MNSSELSDRDDVNWLAQCYVHGELSIDDAIAFEARLASDDAACDAVARASSLSLAIAASFEGLSADRVAEILRPTMAIPQPAATLPARRTGIGLVALVAAALSAAAVMLIVQPAGQNSLARREGAAQLVAAWANDGALHDDLDDDDDGQDGAELASLDPPDWMFAALMAVDPKENDSNPDDSN